jgi:hypothetical protein
MMGNLENPFFYTDFDYKGNYEIHVSFISTVNPGKATIGIPVKYFMTTFNIYGLWE